jgi:DNA repair photolyase
MSVKEIKAKTLLRIPKKIDSWFVSRYHLNLYRGCRHNCIYCDGRAYAISRSFARDKLGSRGTRPSMTSAARRSMRWM